MENLSQNTNPQNVDYIYIGCFASRRVKGGKTIYAKNYGKKCFPIYRKVKRKPDATKNPSKI